MQGLNGLLNTVTYPPGAGITDPRIVIDGVRGALFVYASGGTLIGSWAISAGTDPYGNSYPQGLSVSVGAIEGSSFLVYQNNTPAANALLFSISGSSFTDAYGNDILPGFVSYYYTSGTGIALQVNVNSVLWWVGATGLNSWAQSANLYHDNSGTYFYITTLYLKNAIGTSVLDVDEIDITYLSTQAGQSVINVKEDLLLATGKGIYTDTWSNTLNTFTFANGWSTAGAPNRYKAIGEKSAVWLQMNAAVGTSTANGTIIATVDNTSLRPTQNQFLEIGTASGTAQLNDSFCRVDSTGAITVWYLPTGVASIRVNDIYALD